MKIRLKDSKDMHLNKGMPAHAGLTRDQIEYNHALHKLAGHVLTVETDHLFDNQFNVSLTDEQFELIRGGIYGDHFKVNTGFRIMMAQVAEVIDDIRGGMLKCQWCGAQMQEPKQLADAKCSKCSKRGWLYRLFSGSGRSFDFIFGKEIREQEQREEDARKTEAEQAKKELESTYAFQKDRLEKKQKEEREALEKKFDVIELLPLKSVYNVFTYSGRTTVTYEVASLREAIKIAKLFTLAEAVDLKGDTRSLTPKAWVKADETRKIVNEFVGPILESELSIYENRALSSLALILFADLPKDKTVEIKIKIASIPHKLNGKCRYHAGRVVRGSVARPDFGEPITWNTGGESKRFSFVFSDVDEMIEHLEDAEILKREEV